jgi:hypothetical protein
MTQYRRKLAIAILIWTVGALPLVAAAVQFAIALTEPIHDFTAPGTISARLGKGDEKAILLQTRGSDLGSFGTDDVRSSELECAARSAGGERAMRARRIGIYTITHGSDTYVAKVGFTAPAAGRYLVRCDLHATAVEHAPLGFSDHVHLTRVFAETFAALALCAATIMAGVLIVRRARRATRR